MKSLSNRLSEIKASKIALLLIGIFAIALGLRLLAFNKVFVDGNVVFMGYDSYYHIRRIVYTTAHFPNNIFFDYYINYPYGAKIGWPPLYDIVIAFIALIIGLGAPSVHTIEVVSAIFPAVLGALTIFPVYFIAKEIFDWKIGIFSAGMMAIIPAQFNISQIGYTDHHVAEVFLFALLIMLFLIAIRKAHEIKDIHLYRAMGHGPSALHLYAGLSGFVIACMEFTWVGAPIYIGIIGLYAVLQFILYHLFNNKSSDYLVIVYTIMFLTAIIFSASGLYIGWISEFQFLSLVAIFLIIIGFGFLSKLMTGKKWYAYPIMVCVCGILFFILIPIMLPQFYQYIESGINYLIGGGEVLGTITEAQPLFKSWIFSSKAAPFYLITYFIAFFAFIVYSITNFIKIKLIKPESIFLIIWTLVIFALTYEQVRFMYILSVNISIFLGYALLKAIELMKLDRILKQYI
ncbi:MAG: STT3 domain-containing protein, partial [Methanosarcinales archaeon]